MVEWNQVTWHENFKTKIIIYHLQSEAKPWWELFCQKLMRRAWKYIAIYEIPYCKLSEEQKNKKTQYHCDMWIPWMCWKTGNPWIRLHHQHHLHVLLPTFAAQYCLCSNYRQFGQYGFGNECHHSFPLAPKKHENKNIFCNYASLKKNWAIGQQS